MIYLTLPSFDEIGIALVITVVVIATVAIALKMRGGK